MMVDTAGEFKEEQEEMEDSDESDSEQENDENILPANIEIFVKDSGKKKKVQKKDTAKDEEDAPLFKLEGNKRMKKAQKMQQKKMRKNRRRAEKLGSELGNKMESAFSGLKAEAYDFKTDFTD